MKRAYLALPLLLLCSNAFAADATQSPGLMGNIIMIGGFLAIFYFMLIRPQTKRAKEHQNLIAKLAKEDEVITAGGILGKVVKVAEQFVVIMIADGIEIVIQKQAISAVMPKGTMKNI